MKSGRRASGLSPLAEVLAKVLGERGMAGTGAVGKLQTGWVDAVGKGLASHCSPDSLKGKLLYVTVDSSAWMNQISMLRLTLVGSINAYLGADTVEDVRFRVGKVAAPGAAKKARAPFVPRRRKVTASEADAIDSAVSGIKDEGVRERARKLLVTACSREP
ncbi:MAG: DUF721 domain-containing protein [Nitrospirae bacterium]|nr:DUF721 domain-containing protein [Nitrospirota bacterium]MBI5694243.1 DUF721 domain-containing protein [Nitrospirota bacterium]